MSSSYMTSGYMSSGYMTSSYKFTSSTTCGKQPFSWKILEDVRQSSDTFFGHLSKGKI